MGYGSVKQSQQLFNTFGMVIDLLAMLSLILPVLAFIIFSSDFNNVVLVVWKGSYSEAFL